MTENVTASQSTDVQTGRGALGERAEEESPEGAQARGDETGDSRRALADDLLNELTAWAPKDRMGTFKTWHRGSLSLVHLNVVTVLEAEGPLSMRHLADALDVSDASATGIVDRMERRGLVERRHAADDRRVVRVELTTTGADIFRQFGALRRERLSCLLERLTESELAGFLSGVRAMRIASMALAEEETATPAGDDPIAAEPLDRPRLDDIS